MEIDPPVTEPPKKKRQAEVSGDITDKTSTQKEQNKKRKGDESSPSIHKIKKTKT